MKSLTKNYFFLSPHSFIKQEDFSFEILGKQNYRGMTAFLVLLF